MNGTIKKLAYAAIVLLVTGWITWVTKTVSNSKAVAQVALAVTEIEREHIRRDLVEIKQSLKDLKRHLNLP